MKKMITTLGILVLTQIGFINAANANFDCPAINDPKPEGVAEWGMIFGAKLVAADYKRGPQYSVNIWEVSNGSLNKSLNNMDRQVTFAGAGKRNQPGPRGKVHEVSTTPIGENKTRVVYIVEWNLAPRSGPEAQAKGGQFAKIWAQFAKLVDAYNWTVTQNPKSAKQYNRDIYNKFHQDICKY